ncbi:RNA-splicing factor [Pleurotus ostreatus]|uniref:Pre-mRNA-splicing factor CWC24 n=1 Tax=Pleurotus ostreatus TaxID=5322 RepID=A0A8H6ZQT3_PLEOS|nr:RNA-splicing factor [Pleurotus ostreatus]KAF7427965.1 RNA-splicing factor [Pleurotus ostreatus]KAJ8695995.1 RNA-splicing factor [Pleurotus ostreatus]
MSTTEEVRVPFFKKKGKGRPTTSRKRSPSPNSAATGAPSSSASKSEVVLPNRKGANNLLSAGTKRTTSQRDDDIDAPERDGPDVKWKADGSHVNAALEILAGDEAEEMLAKRRKKSDLDDDEEEGPDDGQYHGQKGYRSHLKKSKEVPKAMRVGPQRNTSTIRTVTIVDYQPDVCKDYKETGYCGFGDTCKFLHDRGTYLQGWQLDKLAENATKDVGDVSESDSDEDIPFACLICRKHYTDPVVTRCGHYFCSACAIKRFAKTPRCIACGSPTGGIFNRADKIIEKASKSRKQKEEDEETEDNPTDKVEIEGLGAEEEASNHSNDDSD